MKKYFKYLLLINLFVFISCLENGQLKESKISKTKLLIINNGDEDAYEDLRNYYLTNKDGNSIMSFSMIMAYKFKSALGYYDLFDITIRINNYGNYGPDLIKNLDLNSRKFAIDNLIKSAELGNFTAKEYLIKYYRDGLYLKKDIELAKKLEAEIK